MVSRPARASRRRRRRRSPHRTLGSDKAHAFASDVARASGRSIVVHVVASARDGETESRREHVVPRPKGRATHRGGPPPPWMAATTRRAEGRHFTPTNAAMGERRAPAARLARACCDRHGHSARRPHGAPQLANRTATSRTLAEFLSTPMDRGAATPCRTPLRCRATDRRPRASNASVRREISTRASRARRGYVDIAVPDSL